MIMCDRHAGTSYWRYACMYTRTRNAFPFRPYIIAPPKVLFTNSVEGQHEEASDRCFTMECTHRDLLDFLFDYLP